MEDGVRPESAARIMLRPLGSPLPLGFFAFGVGTTVAAALELGWLPHSEARAVALVALLCSLPLEAGAALLAFLARDGAGGTILGLFASSWAVLGAELLARGAGPQPTIGVFCWLLGLASVLIAAAAVRAKPLFASLLALAALRFAGSGVYRVWPSTPVERVTGAIGIALAVVAFYGAEALLIEDTQRRTVLPVFRREAAQEAIEGGLGAQLDAIEREAGVRQQL